jgi:hypothetical protein
METETAIEPDLTVVLFGATEREREQCAARARRLTARAMEAVSAPAAGGADTPGSLRNAAVRASNGRQLVFLGGVEPPDSSFLEAALRTLARNPDWWFVAAWHDGVPQTRDRPAKLLGFSDLLARPWFIDTPTVFRRELWQALGGFDEELRGLEDLDFWIRALASGKNGAVIEEPVFDPKPWGPSLGYDHPDAKQEARRVFERHAKWFEAHWEETLLGKERIVRELFALRSALEKRAVALRGEESRLSDLLARAAPGGRRC